VSFDAHTILLDDRLFADLPGLAAGEARMALMQSVGAAHWERQGKARFARLLRREARKSIERAGYWLAFATRHASTTTTTEKRTLH